MFVGTGSRRSFGLQFNRTLFALALFAASQAVAQAATASNPFILTIAPHTAMAGAAGLTLKVQGRNFMAGSVVQWNGTPLSTTLQSSRILQATVPASSLSAGGSVSITVIVNGHTSNAQTLTVQDPVPVVTAAGPAPITAGTFTVTGRNFLHSSVVRWNAQLLSTSYVSATQLQATVPLGYIQAGQHANITVSNPAPGGGISAAARVLEANLAPTLGDVSPSAFVLGQSDAGLTLTGTDFVPGSTVYWNSTALATTYVSATQLTAVAPAALFATGPLSSPVVTVVNAAPGGGTSGQVTVSESNPTPAITSVSPDTIAFDQSGTVLTVTGSGFLSGSVIHFNGNVLATTYVSSTSLTAVLPDGEPVVEMVIVDHVLTVVTGANVTVTNPAPGGGTSNTQGVSLSFPAPMAGSVSPNRIATAQGDTTLTLTGTDFTVKSTVCWNGAVLATTYVSPTMLTAVVPAADLVSVTTAAVTIGNPTPGGGTSAALQVKVLDPAPVPAMTSISQIGFTVGQGDALLSIGGTGFVSGTTTVYWGSTPLPTTYVSSTSLKAAVPASLFAPALFSNPTFGYLNDVFPVVNPTSVTIVNAAPGGGTSNAATVGSVLPTPQLVPQSLVLITGSGNSDYQLVVSGMPSPDELNLEEVVIDGTAEAIIGGPTFTLGLGGAYRQVLDAVTFPGMGPTVSGTSKLSIINQLGTLSNQLTVYDTQQSVVIQGDSTPAAYGVVGTAGLQVTLTGQGFLPGVTVYADGTSRPTTWISDTAISFALSQADVAAAHVFTLTLQDADPGTEVSPPYYYPVGLSLQEFDEPVNDMVWDSTNQVIYLSTPASEPFDGQSIITFDPATFTETNSVALTAAPDVLAISDDDTYLYAGTSTAATPGIQRLTLPDTVPDIGWTLGSYGSGGYAASAIAVQPGTPGTVAVGLSVWGGAQIFDDGVARPTTDSGDMVQGRRYDGLSWSTDGSALYASNFNFGTSIYQLTAGASGPVLAATHAGIATQASFPYKFYTDSYSGYVFSDNGDVYAPWSGTLQTCLFFFNAKCQATGVALDDTSHRLYVSVPEPNGTGTLIYVYSLPSLLQLGSIDLPMVYPAAPSRLIRWGAHGLAIRNGTSSVYVIQGDFVH